VQPGCPLRGRLGGRGPCPGRTPHRELWRSRIENSVSTDSPPDYVRRSRASRLSVLPGSSAIRCPCHLKHARSAPHAFDTKPGAELASISVRHKLCDHDLPESFLLDLGESRVVPPESRCRRERRHQAWSPSRSANIASASGWKVVWPSAICTEASRSPSCHSLVQNHR
jgi:hypothetical protein